MSNKTKLEEDFFNKKKIKKIQKYIYNKYPEWCCNYPMKPLFKNIGEYDWKNLAKNIKKFYSKVDDNSFILDLIKYIENCKKEEQIIKKNNIYSNEMMLYYLQCRQNGKIATIWPCNKFTIKNFKEKYPNLNIYGIKRFILSGHGAESLIYQMYSKEKKLSKYEDIERYIKKLGWENKSDRKIIKIIYFESEIPISENECKIHVTNNFTNCIELGKIYFNNNSINFLEEQLLKNSMSYKFKDCRSIINTCKNILYSNFSLFDINKFIIYSGSILYSYGIRSCTDIDMFVSDKPKQIFTKDYYEKIKDFFISDEKELPSDVFHPILNWKDFFNNWHKIWGKKFGSYNILSTINNPKFHFYFMGLKLMTIESDIAKRNLRYRPASIADIIMISKKLNRKIKLNYMYLKRKNFSGEIIETNKCKFIKTVKYWLKKKYNQNFTLQELNKIIKFRKKNYK